jgi:hypothetical protein
VLYVLARDLYFSVYHHRLSESLSAEMAAAYYEFVSRDAIFLFSGCAPAFMAD